MCVCVYVYVCVCVGVGVFLSFIINSCNQERERDIK